MSENEKSGKLIIFLLFVVILVLFVSNIRLGRRISDLENSQWNVSHNHRHEMQMIRSDIWQGFRDIRQYLEYATSLTGDVDVSIQSINTGDLTADVYVSFFLREFTLGDVVSINARSTTNQQVFSAVTNKSETGRFSANITLPLVDNFILNFVADGPTIRTGNLADVLLADELCDRFQFNLSQGSSVTSDFRGQDRRTTIHVTPHLFNRTQGDESLEIVYLSLQLESLDGDIIRRWNLTRHLHREYPFQVMPDGHWWNWQTFEIPVLEQGTEVVAGVHGRGYVMPGEIVIARLIIYDNLSIRYEQSEQIFVPGSENEIGFRAFLLYTYRFDNRVIQYGEHSWNRIRIVRK